MEDIQNRLDIELMVNTFYSKVQQDKLIAHFFTEVIKLDWDKHLPKMYDFWDSIVFGAQQYKGNPMQVHKHIHSIAPIDNIHFDQWLLLFHQTIDQLFQGPRAEGLKTRAGNIKELMAFTVHNQ